MCFPSFEEGVLTTEINYTCIRKAKIMKFTLPFFIYGSVSTFEHLKIEARGFQFIGMRVCDLRIDHY